MNATFEILALTPSDRERYLEELAEILLDCVRNGASVSFMAAMTIEDARKFWSSVFDSVEKHSRVLLVAKGHDGHAVGTVQILTDQPANQPHRADISKLLVASSNRREGVGAALMNEVERYSARLRKSLLVLDTSSGSDAERLYTRLSWVKVGEIPNFSLLPDGTPSATSIFWKAIETE